MKLSLFSVTDHYPDQPRSVADLYGELIEEIELADQLGYSNYFIAEHHFHEYGIVPSPPALLGAAAARTGRIGLGVAVSVLPFHNPVVAAEEYAQLDQMSGGRLALGVGSGYLKHEFDGFGIGPWEKRYRFDEALEILTTAWQGRPFTYHGYYHHVQNVRIAVTPLQQPHPPLWIAVLRPEAAYHVGLQGRDIMLIPYATADTIEDLGRIVSEWRRGRDEAGQPGGDAAVALHTYVGEKPEVRATVEPALQRYVDTRLYARRRSYDELDSAGLALFGDTDRVGERIAQFAQLGVTQIMALANFGALPADSVRASLEGLAKLRQR